MTTEAEAAHRDGDLRWIILRGGLRLPDFDHWRARRTQKPSDPDDVRWECSCGYIGSPETVERHWIAMLPLPTPEAAHRQPPTVEIAGARYPDPIEAREALTDALSTVDPWAADPTFAEAVDRILARLAEQGYALAAEPIAASSRLDAAWAEAEAAHREPDDDTLANRAMHIAFFRVTGTDPGPHATGNATCQEMVRELGRLGFEVREARGMPDLRVAIIRAVAGLDGYENPNTEPGGWWDKRVAPVVAAALAAEPIAASSRLDEAWAEAEAALPEGWLIVELERSYRLTKGKKPGLRRSGWMVKAHPERNPESEWAFGPTPAAALRALAERLRATPEPEG